MPAASAATDRLTSTSAVGLPTEPLAHPGLAEPSTATLRAPGGREVPARYIRALAARDIRGLAHVGDHLLVLDTKTGRVSLVDPQTDDTVVVNEGFAPQFVGACGLAVDAAVVWHVTPDGVRRSAWQPGETLGVGALVLAVSATAVAVAAGRLYLVVGEELHEHLLDSAGLPAAAPERTVPLHGVGAKSISATRRHLWLTDDVEQTVYCLDRETLQTRFRAVTPLEAPTAVAAHDPGSARR